MQLPKKITFEEFPKPSYEEWKEQAIASLKGAPFEKKLFTETFEEILLKPIYNQIDSIDFHEKFDSLPGFAPYLRGNNILGFSHRKWDIAQVIPYFCPTDFNEALINDLESGQNSINIHLNRNEFHQFEPVSVDCGLVLKNLDSFKKSFKNIDLTVYPIYFNSGDFFAEFAEVFDNYITSMNYDKSKILGNLGSDPLGEALVNGGSHISIEDIFDNLEKVITKFDIEYPNFGIITIQGSIFHNSGASATQELAYSLTYAIEIINQLLERNLTITQILPKIRFAFGVSSNFFTEIAKLKAARILWSKITEAFGASEELQKTKIHCSTSIRNKTQRDPWVNLLRNTIECLASILGNADSIEIGNFDFAYGSPSDFSRRISRNTQLVLLYEAHLIDTIDPVAGSYYLDSLTNEIISKTWEILQNVESSGGFLNYIQQGKLQDEINKIAEKQIKNYQFRKSILVGTNKYPLLNEKLPNDCTPYSFKKLDEIKLTKKAFEIKPLQIIRFASSFEKLRNIADNYKSKTGEFPKVILLNFGELNEWKPRNDFSSDFLQVGGFEIINSPVFNDISKAIEFIKEINNTHLFTICSSDLKYEEIIPAVVPEMRKINPKNYIILAGYPENKVEEYKNYGVNQFIHIKSNIAETLELIQNNYFQNK